MQEHHTSLLPLGMSGKLQRCLVYLWVIFSIWDIQQEIKHEIFSKILRLKNKEILHTTSYKKFFFIFFIFKLYIIVLILPNIKMNPPQVYMCSPSWTLLPPPSLYHPSGSSQCTSPKHPISCIKPGLATHSMYDIIRISMPFSQIIAPSPSPTESKRLFYTSMSLLLFCIQGYCYHLLNSTYMC